MSLITSLSDRDAVLTYVVVLDALVTDKVLIVSYTTTRHVDCRVRIQLPE